MKTITTQTEILTNVNELVSEMNFQDLSVGIEAVHKITKELIEEISETIVGVQIGEYTDDSLFFTIGGLSMRIQRRYQLMEDERGSDIENDWVVLTQ